MKRGDIAVAAARGPYTGKPRPVVVIQDDRFDATASVTVCPLTTRPVDAPLIRLLVEPSGTNGLDSESWMMVDKITTMPRANLAAPIGRLTEDQLTQLGRAAVVFLGLV